MSRQLPDSEQERFRHLLMKAVDGELADEDRAEFDRFIHTYPNLKKEWQQFKKLKEVTQTMKFKSPPGEVWETYWVNVYNRIERGFAWIILSLGCVILLTYGGFKAVESIIADPTLASIVKVGILLAIGGMVILLVSVVREKLFIRKADPYKEVQR
ncbi:MAG: hypothetical protein ACE5HO_14420 [bacterium]